MYLSRRLTKRRDVLIGFEKTLHRALIRIEYNSGDLYEAFSDNFAVFVFQHEKPFCDQWHEMVKSVASSLKKEDVTLLTEFTDGLGTSDTEAQRGHIQLYLELLKERIEEANDDVRLKAKVYRIIPLSLGAVIALLLI